MSSPVDDPFTTPKPARGEPSLDLDPPPMLALPTSSPQQLRLTLQAHLTETRKRLEGAGQLGRDLVKQEKDIESRLQDLDESGERIDPELKKKIMVLEKEYNEVGRETARAFLTNKVMTGAGTGGASSPFGGSNISTPGSTYQTYGSGSPSKLNVPSSRRQRNQPSRSHDLEFAAELGQGLIAEVRKLQGLLADRDATLKVVQDEKSKLEIQITNIEAQLRVLDTNEQQFKEENWNLSIEIQRLEAHSIEQKETETKLQAQISQLANEKDNILAELDKERQDRSNISEEMERDQRTSEGKIQNLQLKLASAEQNGQDLTKKVERLQEELEDNQKASIRLQHQSSKAEFRDRQRDPLNLSHPENDTPEHSPPASPTKQTPRHGMLENETLKSSLHHAHRMVTSLKSNIHREKTEKVELKRLLQEARDELETLRNVFGEKNGKRRKGDGTFKKPSRLNISMLGGARKSRDEIFVDEPIDDGWEDNHDESEKMIRNTPGSYISNVPGTDRETDSTAFESAFETANEKDTTDAFETANEADATETEAYRTGVESPAYDNPTSADELTETEEASLRTLKAKASQLSARSIKPLRLNKTRSRQRMDSIVSTASTEDEGPDNRYCYVSPSLSINSNGPDTPEDRLGYDEDYEQPRMVSNPRLKLRINRARSRGSRMPSENSLFGGSVLHDIGSSPTSMSDSSPVGPYDVRNAIIGPRKSLFAELGDSPEMLSNDDGDDDQEQADSGTPTRSARARAQMVDVCIMTEVPYPESFEPVFVQEDHEDRPATAVQIGPAQPFLIPKLVPKTPLPMSDHGIQCSLILETKTIVTETGTQSDYIPELKKSITVDIAIQFDPELERPMVPKVVSTAMSTVTPISTPVINKSVRPVTVSTAMSTMTPISTPTVEILANPAAMPTDIPIDAPTTNGSRSRSLGESSMQFGPSIEAVRSEQSSISPSPLQVLLPKPSVPSPTLRYFGTTTETFPVEGSGSALDLLPTENLAFSVITEVSTSPITPSPPSPPLRAAPVIPVAILNSALLTDKGTENSGHSTGQQSPSPPPSPSPSPSPSIEKRSFFGSIFGGARKERSVEPEPILKPERDAPLPSINTDESENEDTIRKKDNRSRPALPTMVSDQFMQTDLSRDYLDKILTETQPESRRLVLPNSVVDPSWDSTVSLKSQVSQESVGRRGGRISADSIRFGAGVAIRRPGSSSSIRDREATRNTRRPPLPLNHQEQIAAAARLPPMHTEFGIMGPPPAPTHRSPAPAFRPRTPINGQPRRPETPSGSRGGVTPRAARFSSVRSEISSAASRRSSLSSFASEIDERFNMQPNGYTTRGVMEDQPTDPRVIQAITQTMIGEFLWKYTRTTGRGGISHTRHRRFFWVHPYTRTLYWSDRDPQSAGRSELRAKSVAIEAVKVVTDDNPMPPGLHRKSLVVVTPGRSLKFTAPTGARHETWFNALSYLLLRTGEQIQDETTGFEEDDIRDYDPSYSGSVGGATSMSSYYSRTSNMESPSRNTSSLSNRRTNERERMQGSISRLSNIFRTSSGFGTFSSKTSRHTASIYNTSDVGHSGEDIRTSQERDHQRELDRMENVRACCDGKHDVGTLSRKGGKKLPHSFKGRHTHTYSHG